MIAFFLAATLLGQEVEYEPGATLRLYRVEQPVTELTDIAPGQTPNLDVRIDFVDLRNGEWPQAPGEPFNNLFVATVTGQVRAQTAGAYRFRLTSDDGSDLFINGKKVLDNDGVHAAQPVAGTVNLTAGWHPFVIRYFENYGEEVLKWEWAPPGQRDFTVVPTEAMRVPKGLTRVTSFGPKLLLRHGGTIRPGSGLPLEGLHPGWDIMTIRPEDFKPQVGALTWGPDGALLITTFHPNQSGQFRPEVRDGAVYKLTGVTGDDRSKITVKKIAEDLKDPLGIITVDGDVYVAEQFQITRLKDADGDGFYETHEVVANGWQSDNYHHFTFGLLERDGYLYGSLSTSITFDAPGINGPNPPNRGTVFRVDPRRYNPQDPLANIEFLTSGHRTPNGLGWGPGGALFVTENQGSWQPSNKLNHVIPGGFYGHFNNTTYKNAAYPHGGWPGPYDHRAYVPPALYMPQNECSNSPTEPLLIPTGPFAGQMLIGDIKYGGLHRAFLEEVDGVWQGGVVHFTQGFESGMNRMIWGPDGGLYLGGIGASETWGWTDPKTGKETTFGLQRIKPNGKSVFEIERVRLLPDGFEIRFTEPADRASLANPENYLVRQWTYTATVDYGGPKVGSEQLEIGAVEPRADGRSVVLKVPGLKTNHVVYLRLGVESAAKNPLWSAEVWYTIQRMPGQSRPIPSATPRPRLLVFTKTTSFRHDSIDAGVAALRNLANEKGLEMRHTEDATVFNDESLKSTDVVIFLNTTGTILDADQKAAFQRFIRGGGGFIGIHSASDTEYDWPWYGELVGAYFRSHPPGVHRATIKVEDPKHPTVSMLPIPWSRVDEWYDFRTNPRGKVQVLATLDESTYQGGLMGADHPIIWCREFDGGRSWYTGLGHTKETFSEPLFLQSLWAAIQWVSEKKVNVPRR